jgi:hypothetical protein
MIHAQPNRGIQTMKGQKLKKISVIAVSKAGLVYSKNEHNEEIFEIIGENEHLICVDDGFFSAIAKDKTYEVTRGRIEKPSISVSIGDSYWGSSVRYTLWTFKNKRPETIRAEIKAFINQKYGSLFEINLDFINDAQLSKQPAA